MFWGKGDSSKLDADTRKLLDGLRRLEETGHIIGANPEQSRDAFAAMKFFGALTSASGLLAGVRNVSLWVAGALAGWWALKDAIIAFIKGAAN